MLAEIPKHSTGPAMVKILAPMQKTCPSAAVNIGHRILQKHLHSNGGAV